MLAEQRGGGRSNVFLAATLNCGAARSAVRIRNMSQTGALIDGAVLPAAGAKVRLMRGALVAMGSVAWAANGQAGLRFDAELDVRHWTGRPGHAGQRRVDGIVSAVRSGRMPNDGPVEESAPVSLALLSAALDQLCERLANAPAVSIEHGEDLVRLDGIAQALRRHAGLSG